MTDTLALFVVSIFGDLVLSISALIIAYSIVRIAVISILHLFDIEEQ